MTSTLAPVSTARLAANRANAERSTGPRTTAGRAASSRNATKHGLLSRQPLLADEDPADLDALEERLLAALAPGSGIEEVLADDIVSLCWRLRRIARVEAALYAAGLPRPVLEALGQAGEAASAVGVAFAAQAPTFAILNRYEVSLVNRLRLALTDLRRLQETRRAAIPAIAIVAGGG